MINPKTSAGIVGKSIFFIALEKERKNDNYHFFLTDLRHEKS